MKQCAGGCSFFFCRAHLDLSGGESDRFPEERQLPQRRATDPYYCLITSVEHPDNCVRTFDFFLPSLLPFLLLLCRWLYISLCLCLSVCLSVSLSLSLSLSRSRTHAHTHTRTQRHTHTRGHAHTRARTLMYIYTHTKGWGGGGGGSGRERGKWGGGEKDSWD